MDDLKRQAAELRREGVVQPNTGDNFYRVRSRFYTLLLLFIVVLGLPMVAVPALRHRLTARVETLRQSISGERSKAQPLVAQVGENQTPFPKEYERPVNPIVPPGFVLTTPERVYGLSRVIRPTPSHVSPESTTSREPQGEGERADTESPAASEREPQFGQSKIEQEAYDILLKSNETVAGMVQGKDPALRFKTWAAAKTEEDAFLVRVTFVKTPGNVEEQYIWQVKLTSKQVTPLSYNARSLGK